MVQKVTGGISAYEEFTKTTEVVLVDFYADWCGPCRMIAPVLENYEKELQENLPGKVTFGKVNVDEESEMAEKNGVSAMPTFMIYRNGESFKQVVGANEVAIREAITAALEVAAEPVSEVTA